MELLRHSLVVLTAPPAAGKSTIAEELCAARNCHWLRADHTALIPIMKQVGCADLQTEPYPGKRLFKNNLSVLLGRLIGPYRIVPIW